MCHSGFLRLEFVSPPPFPQIRRSQLVSCLRLYIQRIFKLYPVSGGRLPHLPTENQVRWNYSNKLKSLKDLR